MTARKTPPPRPPPGKEGAQDDSEEVLILNDEEEREISAECDRNAAMLSRVQAVIASVAQGLSYGASAEDRDAVEHMVSVIYWVRYWGDQNNVPKGKEFLWVRRFAPIYPDLVTRRITMALCLRARDMLANLASRRYAAVEYTTLQAFLHSIEQTLDAYALSLEDLP